MSERADRERSAGEPQTPGRMSRQKLAGTLVLLLCTAALFAGAVAIFLPFAAPIVVAIVLAILGYPLYQRLLRLVGEKHRGLASGLICCCLLLAVLGPLTALVYYVNESWPAAKAQLRTKAEELEQQIHKPEFLQGTPLASFGDPIKSALTTALKEVLPYLRDAPPSDQQPREARAGESKAVETERDKAQTERAPGAGETTVGTTPGPPGQPEKSTGLGSMFNRFLGVLGRIAGVLGGIFKGAIQFILVLFILFFFLKDGDQILAGLQARIPLEKSQQDAVIQTFKQVTRSVVRGSLVTAAIQGAVATIGYAIIGLPALPLLGGCTTIAALVPPFGTGLIMVPLALGMGFIYGNWGQATFLFVLCGVVGALDNILKPLLLRGGGIRVHSIWLLLAILGGIDVFGPMGFLYGPLVLVLLGTFVALFVGGKPAEPAVAAPAPRARSQPAEVP